MSIWFITYATQQMPQQGHHSWSHILFDTTWRQLVVLVVLLNLVGTGTPVGAKWTDMAEECYEEKNAELQLHACTSAIESGRLSLLDLSSVHTNRGNAYSEQEDYDRAITDYDHAVELNWRNKYALINRGNAYRLKGDLLHALQDYFRALQLDPKNAIAFSHRCRAYQEKGDLDRAIEDCSQALQMDPELFWTLNRRGLIYLQKGDLSRALQDFEAAIQVNSGNEWSFFLRGQVSFNAGQFEDAGADFQKAVELKPSFAYGVLQWYLAQMRAGLEGRNALVQHAMALDVKKWPGPVLALYQELEGVTVETILAAANHHNPKTRQENLCEAYFYAGEYWLIKGRKEEAVKMFQASVGMGLAHNLASQSAKAELTRMGVEETR